MTDAELVELEARAVAAREELARIGDVITSVNADPSVDVDDTWLAVCHYLDIEVKAPVMMPRTVNGISFDRCSYCGGSVIGGDADGASDRHVRWHRRLMAANQISLHVAQASRTTTMLLGALLAAVMEMATAPDRNEEEETHG